VQPSQERRLIHIDQWAVLLDGLIEAPEGEPAERKSRKAK
jgi:hypothetical protein